MTTTCLLLLLTIPLGAPPVNDRPVPERSHRAVRTPEPPVIDGDLSDAVWRLAEPASNFTQTYPDPGKPATFDTVVRVLYDDEALYLAAHCLDSRPDEIIARVTRRDRAIESDSFELSIDSRHGRRTGFWFSLNAAGVLRDGTWFDENQPGVDWDGNWEGAARIVSDGWVAEIRIPLKILRFEAGEGKTFGINYSRWISRKLENTVWQYEPPDTGLVVSRWGTLEGLDLPDMPFSFELAPYIAARPDLNTGTSSRVVRPFDVGLDTRMGLGRNFNLTMAVNPDFGQVEVDQVVLNLSTIETYFPEKRPFFLEDKALFRTPAPGGPGGVEQFYTRRIGRSPRTPDTADDEEIVRPARLPRIYGALKLAGRTEGRLSLGLLQAVTSRQDALVGGPHYSQFSSLAEPLTSFSVLRLKKDFWHHSSVGVLGTAMATPDDGASLTAGGDLQMELFGGDYKLSALSFMSYLSEGRFAWQDSFTEAALEKDGPFGYGGQLVFAKTGGEHLLGSIGGFYYSRNLALNDMGYLDRADRAFVSANIKHRRVKPLGPLANYSLSLVGWIDRTTTGGNLGDGFSFEGNVDFLNGWGGGFYLFSGFPLCDDRETRSEGRVALCGEDHRWRVSGWVWSDSRQPVYGWIEFQFVTNEHGYGYRLATEIAANPHPQIQLELIPGYYNSRGDVRWIDTEEIIEGERFMFADRKIEYWDVTLRATVTFTTRLSLQAYGQLFLAAVDYGTKYVPPGIGEGDVHVSKLVEAFDIEDEYDFSSPTLNISAVLRWEYLPGSVAYLVYTGAFGESLDVPEFRFGRLLDDLFAARARHVLLLKISYLWG